MSSKQPLPRLRIDALPSISVTGLFLIALGYTLYFAAPLFIPIVFAILLKFLLSPIVAYLRRAGIPSGLSSALLVAAIVGVLGFALSVLAKPADRWVTEAPKTMRDIERKLWTAKGHLADIQELAKDVDKLTDVASAPTTVAPVVVEKPSILQRIVEKTPSVIGMGAITLFLTFFLLASGDSWMRRLTRMGRTWSERRMIVTTANAIQSELSRYLGIVTVINICLGLAVAAVMWALGVPNPLLWGAMAGIFNYAPYLGAMASTVVLSLVGLATFPTMAEGLTVPAAFLALTIIEGQLITPMVVGHRMSVDPTIVFLSVLVWGWIWGVPGALMAVPIVTSLKVIADRVPSLRLAGATLKGDVQ
ncbi:MAG: AI-2E family transporter [Lysobacteraceae bacterium]|nr:MAG: AI-2E family transporter [Xanthomonadaceae bacterium]